ncbi:hypothetical protein IV203_015426 [Nitzschia inconspicua]|uniref:Uncharacterized protein n=1 Tax=Nitzschia inconspicua TaxID=303405 RepID=A0A9K3LAY4_9STRA|nr:hypothetical protein IV203_015426 [Nitzschia inconspicua]
MKQQQQYGSMSDDTIADEETALVSRDDPQEDLYSPPPAASKKYRKSLLVVLATVAVFAFLALSGASPLQATASAKGDAAGGPPMFDWKAYGANIKKYWADKKAEWSAQKVDLTAKNATKAESKEAGKSFWNSTMPDFADVLNTTKEAERQQKEAETKANEAAIAEAMAEVEAQRTKKGSK